MSQVSGILDSKLEDLSERTTTKLLKFDKSVFSSENEEYVILTLWVIMSIRNESMKYGNYKVLHKF